MKLLVLQHVPHESPGYIAQYAQEKAVTLDVVELWKPYTIPAVGEYDGMIILGGPMGVYENYPSKNDELTAIKSALGHIPILGLCLGSQILANALGADVHPKIQNGKRLKEVGYFHVDLTQEGKNSKILKGFTSPLKVLQWHGDEFDLPKDATLLVSSALYPNQAFSYKNAYGFLFHFEFTPEMITNQIKIDKQWIRQDNELDENVLLAQAGECTSLMKKQCYQLLDNFLNSKST